MVREGKEGDVGEVGRVKNQLKPKSSWKVKKAGWQDFAKQTRSAGHPSRNHAFVLARA